MTAENTSFNKTTKEDLPIIVKPEFAGFISPLIYSTYKIHELIPLHKEVAENNCLDNPYYRYAEMGSPEVLNIKINNGDLILKAGVVGSFSNAEVGAFVQEQSRNYVDRTTMGHGFPQGNREVERELLSVFINDFHPSDVLIMVQGINDEGLQIIGGARIVRGRSDKMLLDSASEENYLNSHDLSTIPTFHALKIKNIHEDPNLKDIKDLLNVREDMTICITRYWRQDDFTLAGMNLRDARIPIHIIAAMPVAYTLSALSCESSQSVPTRAVFDIHRPDIVDFVKNNFAANIVAQGPQVVATNEILETILRYHYGRQENGGYLGKITIGIFQTVDFLKKSLNYFKKAGIDLNEDTLQILEKVIKSTSGPQEYESGENSSFTAR